MEWIEVCTYCLWFFFSFKQKVIFQKKLIVNFIYTSFPSLCVEEFGNVCMSVFIIFDFPITGNSCLESLLTNISLFQHFLDWSWLTTKLKIFHKMTCNIFFSIFGLQQKISKDTFLQIYWLDLFFYYNKRLIQLKWIRVWSYCLLLFFP